MRHECHINYDDCDFCNECVECCSGKALTIVNNLNHTSVEGLDLIFKVLCLMCKIMIYRLPIRDNIDKTWVNRFEDELNEIMRGVK